MDASQIIVFTTGGTIDKSYFDALSKYQFDRSKIREIIDNASVSLPFDVVPLMAKDSLELTDDDRAAIAEVVSGAAAERIVITHGTDSMAVTAQRLASLNLPKTIVLTGASCRRAMPTAMRPSTWAWRSARSRRRRTASTSS